MVLLSGYVVTFCSVVLQKTKILHLDSLSDSQDHSIPSLIPYPQSGKNGVSLEGWSLRKS